MKTPVGASLSSDIMFSRSLKQLLAVAFIKQTRKYLIRLGLFSEAY